MAIVIVASAAACAAETIVLADRKGYTKGAYTAFAQPWGAGALREGVDYVDSVEVTPASFPAGTTIRWHWPLVPPTATGVYAFNAIDYGDYLNTVPEHPITPRRIGSMPRLTVSFDLSLQRSAGDANILAEFFATEAPGSSSRQIAEIGFFLHTPDATARFMASSRSLGVFVDRHERAWQAAINDRYCMFSPVGQGDVLVGKIDFKGAVDFLRARKILTGEQWFNGGAIGIEPITGSGALRVNALSFDL